MHDGRWRPDIRIPHSTGRPVECDADHCVLDKAGYRIETKFSLASWTVIMTQSNSEVLDFFKTRRSSPAIALGPPVPNRSQLMELLEMAVRVPDHGKLEPWRFIILERQCMPRLARKLKERGARLGKSESLVAKAAAVFECSSLIVAVVSSHDVTVKIPSIEQTLSAGCVCLSLLNASLASGWGASWVTGFGAHDPEFREAALGLEAHEFIAGFVHIGTSTAAPPERPRPNVEEIASWAPA